MWKSVMPSSVVDELYDTDKAAWSIVETMAQLCDDFSERWDNELEQNYFLSAWRGQKSGGTARVRANATKTLASGAKFRSYDGRVYATRREYAFTAGVYRIINLYGLWDGPNYDIVAEDEIEAYVSGLWIDPTTRQQTTAPTEVLVSSSQPFINGRYATLDMLARNRGVFPIAGETREQLRDRAWSPPYTITPEAILREGTLAFWASQPSATAPYTEVELLEPLDAGWALDDDFGWEDTDAYWVPTGAWFDLFLPGLNAQEDLTAFDDATAWTDDWTWDSGQPVLEAIYDGTIQKVQQIKAGGVRAWFFIGDTP
jgi:hypothetical protein